jgi:ABC-2 type transport system ATP-binding protein
VDPISRREFWDLIRAMAGAGTAIFVTTHYMDEAEHCHALAFIYQGRIIATGPPAALKAGLHGCLLEVEVPPGELVAALGLLQSHPLAREAAMFGASLHVTVESAQVIPTLQAWLRERGISLHRMQAIQPSLEDVFVSLVAREAGA